MKPDQQSESRIQTICLLVLCAVAIGVALYWLRPVIIPFVLAAFFTYCLIPLIDLQVDHLRVPRLLAAVVTGILGCVLLFLLWLLISASVTQMRDNAHIYEKQLSELTEDVVEKLPLELLGLDDDKWIQQLRSGSGEAGADGGAGGGNIVAGGDDAGRPRLRIATADARAMVGGVVGAVMSLLSNGLLVIIFMLFMLMGHVSATTTTEGLLAEVQSRVKRYIVTKVLVSALTGVLIGTILAVLGVEFALVFGVLAFLFNFIPNIGSVVSTLLPLPVVLLSPDLSVVAKVLAFVLPGLAQFAIGNVIEPKVMGSWLDLHPITILIALIFFGMLWGIVGMFLAAPLTAIAKILLERGGLTRPIASLLAGRLSSLSGPE